MTETPEETNICEAYNRFLKMKKEGLAILLGVNFEEVAACDTPTRAEEQIEVASE